MVNWSLMSAVFSIRLQKLSNLSFESKSLDITYKFGTLEGKFQSISQEAHMVSSQEAHMVLWMEAKTACSIDELLKCQEEINREIISTSSFSNNH